MDTDRLHAFLGLTADDYHGPLASVPIHQHHWDKPESLIHIGTIPAADMDRLSGGLLVEDVPVTINRRILQCDEIVLVGPVFPHEVVGFSGGYKYLFPGISGPDFLHRFHWLGALITNPKINGRKDTPVRAALNHAAAFIRTPVTMACYVVANQKMHGFYMGGPEAWSAAADLSAVLNIRTVPRSWTTVLSMAPPMYDDIWTAGKCMYKLEPVVADGGTLVIYAPHIREVSYTHGRHLLRIGYHTRDYFLAQMERFRDVPGAILAHSTHVKGIGTFTNGVEKPRIQVVLATAIPQEVCQQINLGYRDPTSIRQEDYEGREDRGILVVRDAGEVLYRLADGTVPDIDRLR